jgi:hypothetical protein
MQKLSDFFFSSEDLSLELFLHLCAMNTVLWAHKIELEKREKGK